MAREVVVEACVAGAGAVAFAVGQVFEDGGDRGVRNGAPDAGGEAGAVGRGIQRFSITRTL